MTDLTDLTERDIRLCEAMAFWIEVARGREESPVADLLQKLADRYGNHENYCPVLQVDMSVTAIDHDLCTCGYWDLITEIDYARRDAHTYKPDWLPTRADVEHSALFSRIRKGKDPLPYPPPRAYAQPWYEVIEEDKPHACPEPIAFHMQAGRDLQCSVHHCLYDCITNPMSDPTGQYVLGFGPYRFRAWSDPVTHRGWIQRAKDLEQEPVIRWQQETTDLDSDSRTYVGGEGTFTYAKRGGEILNGRISGPRRA